MASCDISDINLLISYRIDDFKLFIYLSHLDKKSNNFIINTSIYKELIIFKYYDWCINTVTMELLTCIINWD